MSDENKNITNDIEIEFKKFKDEVKKTGERFFLVYVDCNDGEIAKVKLPLNVVKILMRTSKTRGKLNFNGVDVDMDMLKDAIDRGSYGRVTDIVYEGNRVIIEII